MGRSWLMTVAVLLVLAAPAAADRKATADEEAAIERVAVEKCAAPQGDCAFQGARVSTADARFGWGRIVGEGISGVLVKRTRGTDDFRVVGVQGGGIGSCRYWRKRAPRRALKDLRVRGLVKSGATRNCGKR